MNGMFYVYTLSDPRCGTVFYVGKGKRQRAWMHTIDVQNGRVSNKAKSGRIAAILASGYMPIVTKVASYELEQDAFDHEADLIAATQNLTNIMAGGGKGLTPSEYALRQEERKNRIAARKDENTKVWLREWLSRVDKWPGVTFPNLKNGDALAQEFVHTVRAMVAVVAPEPNI